MAEGSYTVLARRFRPQGFADVVGQEHISQALRNAIRSSRVAHAYLFTGARGVGKTSTARILAKALNCPQAKDGNPCNSCEICDGIAAGNDVDVLEIDGASNRRIDDIRDVRAKVNVRSMRSQYKIYIIDEVHMLTTEAFNALLKTLEEPPPNVKFVFCTTEPNKLPDTILSRCQRFDFGTIETTSIKGRLAQIAEAEGVAVDGDALELVARRAAGSMRDSQSIFDQLLAFGEEHIQARDVHRLLGTAGDDRLIEIGAALVRRDQAEVLASFHSALDEGVQLGELTDQILFYLRDLMILATGAEQVELLSVAPGSRGDLAAQAEQWGLETILAAMQILGETKGRMQRVTYGRALAELALVRIALLDELTSVAGLIEKLRDGEAKLAQQPLVAQKKSDVTSLPKDISVASRVSVAALPSFREGTPGRDETAQQISSGSGLAEVASVGPAPRAEVSRQPSTGSRMRSDAEIEASSLSVSGSGESPGKSEAPREIVSLNTDNTVSDRPDSPFSSPAVISFSPENAGIIWAQVVSEINDMLKSHVKAVREAAISAPNCLELIFPPGYDFAKRCCEQPDALRRIEEIASRLTGLHVRVSLVVSQDLAESDLSVPQDASEQAGGRKREFRPEEDEFVTVVMETFSAQCVRVDPIASKHTGLDGSSEETGD